MTDPAHREIRVCFPWIRPRSDSKLRGWPGSRGRRKKRDGRAAHHTSREARRRSCPFGGCEHDRRHHGGPRRLERACQAPRRRNALKYTHLPFMAAADQLAKRAKGGSDGSDGRVRRRRSCRVRVGPRRMRRCRAASIVLGARPSRDVRRFLREQSASVPSTPPPFARRTRAPERERGAHTPLPSRWAQGTEPTRAIATAGPLSRAPMRRPSCESRTGFAARACGPARAARWCGRAVTNVYHRSAGGQ
jgi:hypothetical protein